MLQNDCNEDHGHSNFGDPMRENALTNPISGLTYTVIWLRVKIPMKMSVYISSSHIWKLTEKLPKA